MRAPHAPQLQSSHRDPHPFPPSSTSSTHVHSPVMGQPHHVQWVCLRHARRHTKYESSPTRGYLLRRRRRAAMILASSSAVRRGMRVFFWYRRCSKRLNDAISCSTTTTCRRRTSSSSSNSTSVRERTSPSKTQKTERTRAAKGAAPGARSPLVPGSAVGTRSRRKKRQTAVHFMAAATFVGVHSATFQMNTTVCNPAPSARSRRGNRASA